MSGRILVVDDVATNRILLKAKLATVYYEVILAQSGEEALELARREEPDLILLDVCMPGLDGPEVCARLKADDRLCHIPVVMITAVNSPEERIRGLEAGADDFLSKPVRDLALFSRVRNLVRMKMMFDELRMRDLTSRELGLMQLDDTRPEDGVSGGHVLFVADPLTDAEAWAAQVAARLNLRTSVRNDARKAMHLVQTDPPDAIVVSQLIRAGEDGRRLVGALRSNPDTRMSAIIFAVQGEDIELAAEVLDIGASDYILTPFEPAELVARLSSQLRRKSLSDRLRNNLRDGLRLAMVDPLTGLFNRRYATRHLETILARARETGRSFGAMILDLDRFKAVNDRFGHQVGDEVLKEFSRRLAANVRGEDLIARLGGEEFFVVMPDVEDEDAAQAAERIRAAIEQPGFSIEGSDEPLDVTVSIGVSIGLPGNESVSEVIRRADAALYSSKHGGRNRVTLMASAA